MAELYNKWDKGAGRNRWENPWGERLHKWQEGVEERKLNQSEIQNEEFLRSSFYDRSDLNKIIVKNRRDIFICIDPGHGIGSENRGSVGTSGYRHKVRGTDGNPVKNQAGNDLIQESLYPAIPDYIFTNRALWNPIRIPNNEQSEARLTFAVGAEMTRILRAMGYVVIPTRLNRDDGLPLDRRVIVSNNFDCDYFISLHADGSDDYRISGAHAIYQQISQNTAYNERQRNLAVAILEEYNLVELANSPRIDVRDLRVLNPFNEAPRKCLVELGFVTNPINYSAILDDPALTARQLVDGLESNIRENFKIRTNKVLGYEYEGKTHYYPPTEISPLVPGQNSQIIPYKTIYDYSDLPVVAIPA